ncbi:alpha/beta hydrolase [Bowmanella yangjiangensis]|uniref:Alpha/beta hydrolase fold domain-containing protein n=1 Tax=Bowmanella yangjiangensis TaxID=2811230 RepID=A0ABS3CZ28_9ALTE|nr:alpha/beta hydrolase fold domain-containing protein [Bowmanella yangjiangensis]MBN7820854.1 alpha/beta hydrolase fold domain-containing protein [Bowmanella yangjiangensis]
MSSTLPYVEVNPTGKADAVVIWLHGLGDSGNGFAPIVPELKLPESLNVRFLFPHAPVRPVTINNGMQMRAWYDIKSLDFENRADIEGVTESMALVRELVEAQMASGIPSERILLAGFSQGGVIAYHLGLRFEHKLAGIMALSTYMCQPEKLAEQRHSANQNTEILVAHGLYDEVVPCALGKAAFSLLESLNYPVKWRDYPMQHNVCLEEIQEISQWLSKRFSA